VRLQPEMPMDETEPKPRQDVAAANSPVASAGSDRLAEPVNLEAPPRLPFAVVGIGGSAGSLESFRDFFKARADGVTAFVVIQHCAKARNSLASFSGRCRNTEFSCSIKPDTSCHEPRAQSASSSSVWTRRAVAI
jgi:chemotaxis response regulator CheB